MPSKRAPRTGPEPIDVSKPPSKKIKIKAGPIYKALTPEQMERIATLRAEGKAMTEISEQTNIAIAYISGYISSADGKERVENMANNLKFEWGDIATLAIGEIHKRLTNPETRKKMDAKDLNYTAAIATDKFMNLHEKITNAAPPKPGDEKRFSAEDIKEFLNTLPHAMKDEDGDDQGDGADKTIEMDSEPSS